MDEPTMTAQQNRHPVLFGEVLFDTFPDGAVVLGGAPFNVAWHLQGFGLRPLLISRIGDDALGERIVQTMHSWGMDSRGVQTDPGHPTGVVKVSLEGGQPSFSILPDQAYDFIEAAPARDVMESASPALLYHGTLALRTGVSRDALYSLRGASGVPLFVDVNLRAPWWDRALVGENLDYAYWAKLNDAELRELSGEDSLSPEGLRAAARRLRCRHDLRLLVVTGGAAGAFFVTEEGVVTAQPVVVEDLVDTVGAGDAFSAVTLLGLIKGWSLPIILQHALEFASAICAVRGATIHDRALYRRYLEGWERSHG